MAGVQKCGCVLYADGSVDLCGDHQFAEEIRTGLRDAPAGYYGEEEE